MPEPRRTPEEVKKAVAEIDTLRAGGMLAMQAIEKIGLTQSIYWKYKKKQRGDGTKGSVKASSLPPRPKKGGKRTPKPIDMNDMLSLAANVAKIDRRLAAVAGLTHLRAKLAARMLKLLKT